MLTGFKERFIRPRRVVTGVGPGIEWVIDTRIGESSEAYQVDDHLELAKISEDGGVTLLTLEDIIKELGVENFGSWILFDTPANVPAHGNSWRVIELDRKSRIATLAFMGARGTGILIMSCHSKSQSTINSLRG
ncbi:hypothetical protein HY045_02475 [Candidatus Woesebacteria bacterium]|nr:hypothetical protein [Candidatus Woesebacteria bacterium]